MEEKKVKIIMEFEKSDVQGVLFLMKEKLTDELWAKLTESPIKIDLEGVENNQEAKVAFICLAIASLEDRG